MTDATSVTLRCSDPRDDRALARLAALDSARVPASPLLVADLDGRLVAAISLVDGAVVADPFVPSQALVELLQARAGQLRHGGWRRRQRWPRLRLRRRAPALG